MDDDFERLVLGHGHHQNHNHKEDLPDFLRDDAAPLAPSHDPFSMVASDASKNVDFGSKKNNHSLPPPPAGLFDVDGPSPAAPELAHAGNEKKSEISSAQHLRFVSDTNQLWDLHRVKILGRGNYGCATLYSTPQDPPPPHTIQHHNEWVVVKDLNMQTMADKDGEIASLRREVQVLRNGQHHPNLVQFVDALFEKNLASASHEPSNMIYILLEYCGGGDLGQLLEKQHSQPNKYLSEDLVAGLLIQTAVALYTLHTQFSTLHRDVKPDNIFLLQDGVTVRLGDFGIALPLDSVTAKAKEACGTPLYTSPEMFEEKKYDAATDVWSLGVVFYKVLTHESPFNATSLAALKPMVVQGKFVSLLDRDELPYSRKLREIVQSLLTVDPASRPTLRRILRSSYVKEKLHCVPASVLQPTGPAPGGVGKNENVYEQIFTREVVEAAAKRCLWKGDVNAIPRAATSTATPAKEDDEEAWNKNYEDDEFEEDG